MAFMDISFSSKTFKRIMYDVLILNCLLSLRIQVDGRFDSVRWLVYSSSISARFPLPGDFDDEEFHDEEFDDEKFDDEVLHHEDFAEEDFCQ